MNRLFFVIVLLHLSFTTAANFTQVFEWPDGMDFEWPSEVERTQALESGASEPDKIIEPHFMAVYRTRIFVSLQKSRRIPENGDCNKIEDATGLEVDTVGRMWVLDDGSLHCNSKLWIFDLSNNDKTNLIHHFPSSYYLHDLVLDETLNGYFAYIAQWGEEDIVVFGLERNQSWTVETPGIKLFSIALSPKDEPRQLYLSNLESNELFSISVTALHNGNLTANPKLIVKWTAVPYRMLMDNHGTMYAAFWKKNYIISWNINQPYQKRRIYEVEKLNTDWPFTFALDSSGTFWMTVFNKTGKKSSYRLLKAAVGEKPYYIRDCQTTADASQGKRQTDYSALIGSLAFFLVLSCTLNIWLTLRMRKSKNSNEKCNAGAVEKPTVQNPV
ncbi:Hypothetical predicted protein [Cloeon dipterum]|uniref:Bee-milk protein n=1 Tax=Cloeon dipterum TaxID=197152 RepID=A0A8S1D8C2_9INSE|nr:Hypothetical predicted protein [Cloeon dipterum]